MEYLLLQAATAGTEGIMGLIWPIALMVVFMYLLVIRPQKKRDKQAKEMRNNLDVGDNITTVGGILGRVVSIRDDSLVIESSSDRSKLRITRWAIQSNDTAKEAPARSKSKGESKDMSNKDEPSKDALKDDAPSPSDD